MGRPKNEEDPVCCPGGAQALETDMRIQILPYQILSCITFGKALLFTEQVSLPGKWGYLVLKKKNFFSFCKVSRQGLPFWFGWADPFPWLQGWV